MNKKIALLLLLLILFCSCKQGNNVNEHDESSNKLIHRDVAVSLIIDKYGHLEETGCIGLVFGLCDITQDGVPELFCSLISSSKSLTFFVYSLTDQSEPFYYFSDYSVDEIYGNEAIELFNSVFYLDYSGVPYYISRGLVSSTEERGRNDFMYYKIEIGDDGFAVEQSAAYKQSAVNEDIIFNPFSEKDEAIYLYNCTAKYIAEKGHYNQDAVNAVVGLLFDYYYSGVENNG